MKLTVIQILLVLFAVYALVRTAQRFRSGGLNLSNLLLWSVFWIGVGGIVLLPETTSILARLLGVGRGADVIVYLALVGIFYLQFKMFIKTEDLEREITKLVRASALKDIKDEKGE